MFFSTRTVYMGESMKTFHDVRNALDLNGIKYKYILHNHGEAFMGPGAGVPRTVSEIGNPPTTYEILVQESKLEEAQYLLHKAHILK